jgi:hypothetical protein
MTIEDFLSRLTVMPPDFQPLRVKRSQAGRPMSEAGRYRRVVRELLIDQMREMGPGEHRAAEVLARVREASRGKVPPNWLDPAGKYQTKVDLVAAFARKDLTLEGLMLSPRYGYWQLAKSRSRRSRTRPADD